MGTEVVVYVLVGYNQATIYYYKGYCMDDKPVVTFEFFDAAMFYSKETAEEVGMVAKLKVEEHVYYVKN